MTSNSPPVTAHPVTIAALSEAGSGPAVAPVVTSSPSSPSFANYPLPYGWNSNTMTDGRPYFVISALEHSQWEHPSDSPSHHFLPSGWVEQKVSSGRPYYVNAATGIISWERPLIAPVSAPPVPASWIEQTDPSTGAQFYVNVTTGESTWDRPAATSSSPLPNMHTPHSAAAIVSPWIQQVDPASGKPFWVNTATGQTSWDPVTFVPDFGLGSAKWVPPTLPDQSLVSLPGSSVAMTTVSQEKDAVPHETFFDKEVVYMQTKDSPTIGRYFCSFLLDRSSWKCILNLRKIKGGIKSGIKTLFLAPLPSKKNIVHDFFMGPESSFKVTKTSQFNFCITICNPKATNQVETTVILGFDDSASFEKAQICFQMALNRCARGSGGTGRYADPTLIWDHLVDHEELFKSSFTTAGILFCKRYGCLCSMESRKSSAQVECDSYLLCHCIKLEMEQQFSASGVKLERDIEITKSSSSTVTMRGPHIVWHLERLWYQKRCKSASVIQRVFREQQLIKKLWALKNDLMDTKPRRISSYLRPFRETHIDDATAAQLQVLLNLHAGWLGFGEVRNSLKVLFAAPLEGVVAPCAGDTPPSPYEWLSGHFLVIVPEFVLILGQILPNKDAKLRKFSFQDVVPEIFVRQVLPISEIHEAVLSTFADNAMILKVSKTPSVPQKWGFPRRSNTSEHTFCANCLSKFHILKRKHACPACSKVFCDSCCPSEMRTFPTKQIDSTDITLSRSCFDCYFLEPRVVCFDICMRCDHRTDCMVVLQRFKSAMHSSALTINLKPQAEVSLALSSIKTLSLQVCFGSQRPSGMCIYIESEESAFPGGQVQKVQKCIDDGMRSRERNKLIKRLYLQIQRDSPEFLHIVQSNVEIMKHDDEQLIDHIRSMNLFPSFVHDEIARYAHGTEEIQDMEKQVCVFLCRQYRTFASQEHVAEGDGTDLQTLPSNQQHLCKFQVQDLEHCFGQNIVSSEDVEDLAYNITVLSAEEIEHIINERQKRATSSAFEVNAQRSLSLIYSLCMSLRDSQKQFIESDEPVLLIGNTGCGKFSCCCRCFYVVILHAMMKLVTGKSTTVNFLLGRKMEKITTAKGRSVIAVASNDCEISGIGHDTTRSKTLLPQFLNSSNAVASQGAPLPNFSFADFPGFNDTRGFEFNVANATNLKSYLQSCRSGVRILLLVDRRSIQLDRGKSIKDIASLINSMFSGSIDKVESSISVCLTRIDFTDTENGRKPSDEGELNADIQDFCTEFSNHFFQVTASQIQMLDPLSDGREKFLLECVHKLHPIMSPSSYYLPSLSGDDKNHVKKLLDHILRDIKQLLGGDRPSRCFALCDLVKRMTNLGFDIIEDSYKNIQQCVEEGLDRMCKTALVLIDAHDPIQLLRNSIIDKVREILLSDKLQECFPASRIASMLSDFRCSVRDRESRMQQQVDAEIATELTGLLHDLKVYLSSLDESHPVAERLCSITDHLPLQLSECSPSLHEKAFPIHDLHSNMQVELKNRRKLYCNPSVEHLEELIRRLDVESKKLISACIDRLSRLLKFKFLEKIFTDLNLSVEDAVRNNCAPLWVWLSTRPLNDWNMSPLASFGFRPQDIDSVRSIMSSMQQNDSDGFSKARHRCLAFLQNLTNHTRKVQVNFLKNCIKGANLTAEAGTSLHQGRDIERTLNELDAMSAEAEVKEMLDYLVQILLTEPQRKIEAAVRSPDPSTYRRDVSLNLKLLQLARSIPSVASKQKVTYELVLADLRNTEETKLKVHFENAQSSISARLKEFRSECQYPVDLPAELKSAFMELPLSCQRCLESIHLHLGFPSSNKLLKDFAEAQHHLDSVKTIYTTEATSYPIFLEFSQLVVDMHQEVITVVERFEVVCTTEFETAKLFDKLSDLWSKNPRILLDTRDKTINAVQNGLSISDWAAVDEIERKGKKSDSKAPMYADIHEQFMKRFQMNALDQIIDVASHDISNHCQRIPEWLVQRKSLCSDSEDLPPRMMINLEAGLKSYVSEDVIADKVKREAFSELASMLAVISNLKTELHSNGFIQLGKDGQWELEIELLASFKKAIWALEDPTVQEAENLFQLNCPAGDLSAFTRKERFKLKSLRHYCTCFRAAAILKNSVEIQQRMKNLSETIFKRIEPMIERCISSHDRRYSGTVAVKFLYFANLCDPDVFDGIKKDSRIELLQKTIKGSAYIGEVSESVFALRDHKDLGAAASQAIEIFPAFRRMNIQLYNKKAGQMTVEKVLTDLKIQLDPDVFLSPSQKQNLLECFEAYQKIYDDKISELIIAFGNSETRPGAKVRLQQKAKEQTLALAQSIRRHGHNLWKQRVDVGKMLGLIFAVWTILETDESDSSSDADFKQTLLQPHATQIITILMILGIDTAGVAQNHLAEVKTGEGKSITLGALSIMFALLGQSVNVVCYNPYLSTRDWLLFEKVFTFFELSSCCTNSQKGMAPNECSITYCTIDDLVSLLMENGSIPNIRQVALQILSNRSSSSASIKLQQQNRVLLIDEVDVFFGQDFFGQCQHVALVIDDSDAMELLEYIFDNRASLSKNPDVESVMQQKAVKKLTQRYPGLLREDILKGELRKMLHDLREFPGDMTILHDCVVSKEQNNVGYVDKKMAGVNFNQYAGYKTIFAYLHYCSTADQSKKIEKSAKARQYGLLLLAGCVMYSELPKCFGAIHGLSGTVRYLGQNESKILDEYKFERRSYIPSTFQKSALQQPTPLFVHESSDEQDFFFDLKEELSQKLSVHRTTLVVFDTYSKLQRFQRYMEIHPITNTENADEYVLPESLHDEMNDDQRNGVISRSMGKHKITLMTKTFGRGTDFKCHNREIDAPGGVHVVLTYLPQSMSEKVQIQGRTCRQDYRGSFREMFWAKDLEAAGYVTLVHGKVDLEGHSGNTAMQDLLECKRKKLDDHQVEEMFKSLESNSALWNRTRELIQASTLPNIDGAFFLDAALSILKEFQNPVQAKTKPSVESSSSHTVFIIDESGSMSGQRWESLQRSFSAYVQHLVLHGSPCDVISVIQFSTSARTVADKCSRQDAQNLTLDMKGGGTSFGPALKQTMSLLETDASTSDIVLVFMTDGENGDDGDEVVGILRDLFQQFAARNPKFNAIGLTQQPKSLLDMVAAVHPHGFLYGAEDSLQLQQRFVEIAEAMCMSEGIRRKPKP